jgi:hypothetical protein
LKNSDYDSFREITGLLNDVYQCRNMNHRGNTLTQWEEETLGRIVPMKSFYYFKFLGCLAQFVEYVRNGSKVIPEIAKYAKSIEVKKVGIELNVKGKIDLSQFDKNNKKQKK